MDLQYFGGNCVALSGKETRLVIDDNLTELGAKSIVKPGDIVLYTGPHGKPQPGIKLLIDGPGEYEVSNVSITGIVAQAHIDEPGTQHATMYRIVAGDTAYLIVGHINPNLSDEQLEAIGMIDVMFVPVGGNGYTLDAGGALQVIKKVEPKLVIPTHYADPGLHYAMPQQELEQALKNMSMEPKETVAKLRLKPGELSDATQLVVLSR